MPVTLPTPAEIDTVLALLRETPQRLAASAAPHSAARLARRPGPKGWSAVEHLAHVRGCDAVWTETMYAMLVEDEPALPKFDPRQWAKQLKYAQWPFTDLLAALTARRAELLAVLTPLPLASWARGAVSGGKRHTVYSQARRLALHEREHCEQVAELLA